MKPPGVSRRCHRGRAATSLTEWGGANLEHRYALNYAEQRPTELSCTAVTGGFSISAGRAAMRTSLGVKRSHDLA